MRDEELRQRIRIQLNRGEHLSLLSNAVLVWNAVRIGRITAKLIASDADLSRVSPLAHSHVIPSGTYHFGDATSPALAPLPWVFTRLGVEPQLGISHGGPFE